MGYFPYDNDPGLLNRAVNALSPEVNYSMYENGAVSEAERPFYDEILDEFANPDEYHRQLARELSDPFTIASSGPQPQQFGALWLNRDATNENGTKLLIQANGFLANSTTRDERLRAFFLAREFRDYQILVIDQPSHGLSDLYTPSERKGMFGKGDLSEVGVKQAEAVQNFIDAYVPDCEEAIVRAASLGARQSLDLIAHNAGNPNMQDISKLEAFEFPGMADRRFKIHGVFFGYEFLRHNYYQREWLPKFVDGFEDYLAENGGSQKPEAPGFFKRDKITTARNFWHSVLGFDTGLERLEHITDQGVGVVRIVGESSRIDNPITAIRQWKATDGSFALLVALHESHDGFGHLNRARLASVASRSIVDNWAGIQAQGTPQEINLSQFQH